MAINRGGILAYNAHLFISDHPTIKQLSAKLNRGDEMKCFKLSDNPVLNLTTGEESGMFWIEAV